jgi:hypothetical protein
MDAEAAAHDGPDPERSGSRVLISIRASVAVAVTAR